MRCDRCGFIIYGNDRICPRCGEGFKHSKIGFLLGKRIDFFRLNFSLKTIIMFSIYNLMLLSFIINGLLVWQQIDKKEIIFKGSFQLWDLKLWFLFVFFGGLIFLKLLKIFEKDYDALERRTTNIFIWANVGAVLLQYFFFGGNFAFGYFMPISFVVSFSFNMMFILLCKKNYLKVIYSSIKSTIIPLTSFIMIFFDDSLHFSNLSKILILATFALAIIVVLNAILSFFVFMRESIEDQK